MKTLLQIQSKYKFKTDKNSYHDYFKTYDKLFLKYKYEKINILEIGIWHGESLKLWRKYFPNAEIYGVDIFTRASEKKVRDNLNGFDVHIKKVNTCTETPEELEQRNKFFQSLGGNLFDIIIDDGSHKVIHQINTFKNFRKLLSTDGMYICEDIYDGNLKHFQKSVKGFEYITNQKIANNTLGIYRKKDNETN